jgi:hypothetical protein
VIEGTDGPDLNHELDSVSTRAELAAVLRAVHLRADQPSLRELEKRTRNAPVRLSRSTTSDMLTGRRLPRKAVLVTFLRQCGISRTVPWERTWERVAATEAPAHTDVVAVQQQCAAMLAAARSAADEIIADAWRQAEAIVATARAKHYPSEPATAQCLELPAFLDALDRRLTYGGGVISLLISDLAEPRRQVRIKKLDDQLQVEILDRVIHSGDEHPVPAPRRKKLIEEGWRQTFDDSGRSSWKVSVPTGHLTDLHRAVRTALVDIYEITQFHGLNISQEAPSAPSAAATEYPVSMRATIAEIRRQNPLVHATPSPLTNAFDKGAEYHRQGCLRTATAEPTAMTLREARVKGLRRCPECAPDGVPPDPARKPAGSGGLRDDA